MKRLFFILLIISVRSFSQTSDSALIKTENGSPQRILIINSFDAMSAKVRKNKRELFRELTDSLKGYLASKIEGRTNYKAVIIPGLIQNDSTIFLLIKEHHAASAIVIRSLEVYFSSTGDRETENSSGKSQTTTSYDLCSKNEYSIFNSHEKIKGSEVENCSYFTSRSVNDSHFNITFGPDIVGKKKHTYGIVEKNASKYLDQIDFILNQ